MRSVFSNARVAIVGLGVAVATLSASSANAQVTLTCKDGTVRKCAFSQDTRKVECECVGDPVVTATAVGHPTYQLVSVTYVPPGKESDLKYGKGSTMGSRTEMTSTNEGGIIVQAGTTGVDLEGKWTKGFKNGTAMTWQKSQSTTVGLSGNGEDDAPSHAKDVFNVWVNPVLVVTTNATTNQRIREEMKSAPEGVTVLDFTAEQMADKSKVTDARKLKAWNTMTPSDRSSILSTDPFLTNAALDPARFRKLETLQLLGPDNPGDLIPSRGLTVSYDASTDTISGRSNTVEGTALFGGDVNVFGLKADLKTGVTYSYTYEKMLTDTKGVQQEAELTLKTSTQGYRADVDVYMDSLFGTFAAVPTKTYTLNDQPAIKGTLLDRAGKPRTNELVTVPLPNGASRRVLTNGQGVYRVDVPGMPAPSPSPWTCNGAICTPTPQ
jgi:hypothetical protein